VILSWNHGKHHLNLEAFAEPLSTEAKYWIGFLLADGCICQGVVGLGLKIEDAEHVKKFARFVGACEDSVREFNSVNSFGRNHGVRLRFIGKELVSQLAKYGVVPHKSLTAAVHPDLATDPDFWRGVIDGDGYLTFSNFRHVIGLGGSQHVVEAFSNYLLALTGFKPAASKDGSIFKTGASGRRACIVVSAIYYDGCSVGLDRKMAIAKEFTDWALEKYHRDSGKYGGQFSTEQTEKTLLEVNS
jgi:hypothetical protein